MAGSFVAYEHEVTLHPSASSFRQASFLRKTRLSPGTSWVDPGWLDRLPIGIIFHDRLLLLNAYDS